MQVTINLEHPHFYEISSGQIITNLNIPKPLNTKLRQHYLMLRSSTSMLEKIYIIYDGKHTVQKYSGIYIKSKQVSSKEYKMKFSTNSKDDIKYGTNKKIYTFKIINKTHVKVITSDGQAYELHTK